MRKFKKQLAAIFAVCLLVAFIAVPAEAVPTTEAQPTINYDVYLQLDGIPGESMARNYEKWIVLSNVQFDVAHTLDSTKGGGGSAGKAILNNFAVTKRFDASSIPLFQAAVSGTSIKKGQLVFVTRGDSPVPILTIDLGTVAVSDYSFNNAFETINLQCRSVLMSYSTLKADGTQNPPLKGGWDFTQNKKI